MAPLPRIREMAARQWGIELAQDARPPAQEDVVCAQARRVLPLPAVSGGARLTGLFACRSPSWKRRTERGLPPCAGRNGEGSGEGRLQQFGHAFEGRGGGGV